MAESRSNLRRFLGFLRPELGRMGVVAGLVLVSRALALPLPLIYRDVVDEAIPARDTSTLLWLVAALAGVMLLGRIVGFGLQVTSTGLQQTVLHRVRMALYSHLQTMDLGFFRDHPTGGLLSRLMSDVAQVQSILSRETFEVLASGLQVLAVGGLLLWLQPGMTLTCALVFPVLLGLVALFQRRIYGISRGIQERREALGARFQENLSGMRLIQTLGLERISLASADGTSRALERTMVQAQVVGAGVNLLTVVLTDMPLTLFVWGYGGYMVIDGAMTLGSLLAFHQYLMMLYQPVIKLFRFNLRIQAARAAVDRIYQILDREPEIRDRAGAQALTVTRGEIRFQEVHAAYPGSDELALRGVDLHVPGGTILGIVGPSGAGKTTLVNLLLRFVEPSRGRVTIDGQDVTRVTLSSLRRSIGYVAQEVFLFHDTLYRNIALAREGATREQVEAAARAAHAHGFISALPEGYDTVVGERGVGLSGGERQRIALARVFLQDPAILVLDEATSALDARSEEAVQEAIRGLIRGRTVIIVSHRFSTLRLCQRLAVMAGGRVLEVGSHRELMEQSGLYRALVEASRGEVRE